jgi:predicted nucleic-acid-binding protein
MIKIIDTNIVVRFLLGDIQDCNYKESVAIFETIESGELYIYIMESILLESYYVLTKVYLLPKNNVIQDLISIISLSGVMNPDKQVFLDALRMHMHKNISLVDCLLCSYNKHYNYDVLTFDKKLQKALIH